MKAGNEEKQTNDKKPRTVLVPNKFSGGASQVVLVVKNLPVSAGDARVQIWSLDREDPLEEGMAAHGFLPGESQEQGSLAGCSPRGRKESDMTEVT